MSEFIQNIAMIFVYKEIQEKEFSQVDNYIY